MSSRVVLVRGPRAAAAAGGGCCSGDVRPFDEGGAHRHAPAPTGAGELYRALRESLPDDVAVEVVAPTNWVWLVPVLTAAARRRGESGLRLVRSVRRGMRVSSVLVDGVPVDRGDTASTVAAVVAALRTRSPVPG